MFKLVYLLLVSKNTSDTISKGTFPFNNRLGFISFNEISFSPKQTATHTLKG